MGRASYEFEDSNSDAQVRSLGKKLLQTARQQDIKKDVLLKLLRVRFAGSSTRREVVGWMRILKDDASPAAQQACEHLEKAPQKPSKELDDVVTALGQKSVLSHKDKVRCQLPANRLLSVPASTQCSF